MRTLFLVLFLLLSVAPLSATQTLQTANVEETILKLTREWLDAEDRSDRATLQRIIADDFQGIGPRGNTVFKENVIPLEGSQSGLSISTSDVKARVFGDTAIVTGHGVQKAGEKRALRFTVVFARRNGVWQMVAGHLSAVPPQ